MDSTLLTINRKRDYEETLRKSLPINLTLGYDMCTWFML